MCIADSVCVFPLSRGPCGEITIVKRNVNREEREVLIPLWMDDNTFFFLGKRTQKPFFRSRGFYKSAGARIPVVGHRMKGSGSNPLD